MAKREVLRWKEGRGGLLLVVTPAGCYGNLLKVTARQADLFSLKSSSYRQNTHVHGAADSIAEEEACLWALPAIPGK